MGHTEVGRFDHLHGDEDYVDLSIDDLELAKGDLIGDVLAGKKVGGLSLKDIFDCEANDNIRFYDDLAALFSQVEGPPASAFWGQAHTYITGLIGKRIKQDAIEDRAFNNRRGL